MKTRAKNILFSTCLLCIWALSACSSIPAAPNPTADITAPPITEPTVALTATQVTPSILPALANANYPIDITSTQMAQLKDGVFEESAAPGSASKITVTLGKNQVEGDLNGDGVPDSAVTLIADPGGSGTFTYLAAVINKNGTADPLNSVLLGDRIILKSLTFQSGQIEVEYLDHAANEPLASDPTLAVNKKFKLQDNKLIEVK
ncbi:MAG: hypothetical protein P4L50_23095 [Anaerolineaceae bacterium]|nr:hypothetical protein [Anaerolineaceae bacterium]